jgi:hypothetical protein
MPRNHAERESYVWTRSGRLRLGSVLIVLLAGTSLATMLVLAACLFLGASAGTPGAEALRGFFGAQKHDSQAAGR